MFLLEKVNNIQLHLSISMIIIVISNSGNVSTWYLCIRQIMLAYLNLGKTSSSLQFLVYTGWILRTIR